MADTVSTMESHSEIHSSYDDEDTTSNWSVYDPAGDSWGSQNDGSADASWSYDIGSTWTVTGPAPTYVFEYAMSDSGTANETWGSSGAYSEDGSSTSWYSSYDETNDATDPPTVVAAENTSGGTTTGTPPTVPENPGQSGGEVYWNVPDDWWERQRHLRELAEQAYQDLEHRDDYVDAAFAELNALSDPDTPTASVMQTLGEPTSGRPVYQPSGVASVPNNGQSRAGAFAAGIPVPGTVYATRFVFR